MTKVRDKARFHHKWRWIRVTRLMARDGTACAICALPLDRRIQDPADPGYITFDHILPTSRGGTDDTRNLRLAHLGCNLARGNEPILPAEEART